MFSPFLHYRKKKKTVGKVGIEATFEKGPKFTRHQGYTDLYSCILYIGELLKNYLGRE